MLLAKQILELVLLDGPAMFIYVTLLKSITL